MMDLNRYKTQMQVANFGEVGQQKLARASILVVGAGGLGAACLPYLVGAGIGNIAIMDADTVAFSNLHRQVLYDEGNIGQLKAEVAVDKLKKLNSQINIKSIIGHIDSHNATNIITSFDLVLDCSDNYNAKFSINDACSTCDVPMVSASIEGMSGYFGVFSAKGYANYRSLFNEPAKAALNCTDSGVLGTVSGIFGLMQANETIKYLTGVGEVLNQVLMLDLFDFTMQKISLSDDYISNFKPFEIKRLLQITNETLVDVRTQNEFSKQHFDNAVHVPITELSDDFQISELSIKQDEPIVLYCSKGVRAERAAVILQKNGYTDICLLNVGIE